MDKTRKITDVSGRVYGYIEEPVIVTQNVDAPLSGSSQDEVRAGLDLLKETMSSNADTLKQRYGLSEEQLEQLEVTIVDLSFSDRSEGKGVWPELEKFLANTPKFAEMDKPLKIGDIIHFY